MDDAFVEDQTTEHVAIPPPDGGKSLVAAFKAHVAKRKKKHGRHR